MPQILSKLRKLSFRRKDQNDGDVILTDGSQTPLARPRKLSRKRWSLRRKSRLSPSAQIADDILQVEDSVGQVTDKVLEFLREQQQNLDLAALNRHERPLEPPVYTRDDPMDPNVASALLNAQTPFFATDVRVATEEHLGQDLAIDHLFREPIQLADESFSLEDEKAALSMNEPNVTEIQSLPPPPSQAEHIQRLEATISQLARQVELLLQAQRHGHYLPTPPPPPPPSYSQLYSTGYEDVKTSRYYGAREAHLNYCARQRSNTAVNTNPLPFRTEGSFVEEPYLDDSASEYSDPEEVELEPKVERLSEQARNMDLEVGLTDSTSMEPCSEEALVDGGGSGITAWFGNMWLLFMNLFVCQLLLLRIPLLYQPPAPIVATRTLTIASRQSAWPEFIHCRLLEWKTTCGFAAVILPSILTLLQVSDAATNALTRASGLSCFMLSLISFLSGGALLFRHKDVKDTDSSPEYTEAFDHGRPSLFAAMAVPMASAVWSLVCFLIAVLSFVWQPVPNEDDPNMDENPLSIPERAGFTVMCCVCFVGLGMAVLSLGRRGRRSSQGSIGA